MQPLVASDSRQIGDYRLDGVLGRGGQGTVYLGQNSAGTKVAVKVINAQVAADQNARRRFEREAEAARRVARFCTAPVLDAGIADGRPYIVSEFITGPALDVLVQREGVRSGSGLERLAVATLTALAAIHRAGIVHRDFKPGNVIMGAEGPVVIDFGIARTLDQTATSTVIGTPAYMAPEQFEGGAAGPEMDLFSWAGTMVFAATGRHAFAGDTTPAVMRAILDAEPDLTGVPAALRPLLEKCLVKDPRSRPAADEMLRWLTGERWSFADEQATVPVVDGRYLTFEPPRTKLLEEGEQVPGFDAPGPEGAPSAPLAITAAAVTSVAVVLALTSMVLGSDGLASISFGSLFLSTALLGAAVWRYHLGARIALCSTFPLGVVFVYWAVGLGIDGHYPEVLLWLAPFGLLGVSITLAATFLRRLGKTAMVLGVTVGTSLVVFVVGRLLPEALQGAFMYDNFFRLLQATAAISCVSGGAWAVILSVALVRHARRSPRAVG